MGIQLKRRHLYFVCPTDYLEPVINSAFTSENYYYTSLGNSVTFDEDTTNHIRQLILKNGIQEISFVLSLANPILTDALQNQVLSEIRGLNGLYSDVLRQKKHSQVIYREYNRQFTILSYHLNEKMKELQSVLGEPHEDRPKIVGKIYDRQKNTFHKIYSDVVCTEYFSEN